MIQKYTLSIDFEKDDGAADKRGSQCGSASAGRVPACRPGMLIALLWNGWFVLNYEIKEIVVVSAKSFCHVLEKESAKRFLSRSDS